MSLRTPETVQKLQVALHAKAKDLPGYRFYVLYDKVYRADVLEFAYRCCRANRGAAGVDGQTFADIEAYDVERWLGELAEDLRKKTYRPEAVRRVLIPKPGQPRRKRPLGIPTVRDRVVEMAARLVLDPIFEADLQPEQYAYRPNRSALDAVNHVHALVSAGYHSTKLRGFSPPVFYRKRQYAVPGLFQVSGSDFGSSAGLPQYSFFRRI